MLWRGCFMWPLAIAELGLRYLRSNFSERLWHPLRNPLRTAFKRVKILGLHREWWANLTALVQVCTECAKVAKVTPGWMLLASIGRCGAQPKQGPGHGRVVGPGVVHTLFGIGSIHRSVVGSLYPRKITFPLNITSHFFCQRRLCIPPCIRGKYLRGMQLLKTGQYVQSVL